MAGNFADLFKQLNVVNPPQGLKSAVLLKIAALEKRRAKINLLVFGGLDALSLAGLITAFVYLAGLLAQSGFYQYLSLILSEGGSLAFYWQELIFSLAESLPVFGLIAFLSAALVLVWSMAKTIINFNFTYQKYV